MKTLLEGTENDINEVIKLSFEREVLLNALLKAGKSVAKKSTDDTFYGVRLTHVDNKHVRITATDLTMLFTTVIPLYEEVEEKFNFIINYETILSIAKNSQDYIVNIDLFDNKCIVSTFDFKFKLALMETELFDGVRLDSETSLTFELNKIELLNAFNTISYLFNSKGSESDSIDVSKIVLFKAEKGLLKIVSANGFQLGLKEIQTNESQDFQILLMTKAIDELTLLLKMTEEEKIVFSFNENIVKIEIENDLLILTIPAFNYPNVETLINNINGNNDAIVVNSLELKNKLKIFSSVLDKNSTIKLTVENEELEMVSNWQDTTGGESKIEVKNINEAKFTINLKLSNLLDVVKHSNSQDLILIKSDYLTYIMPEGYKDELHILAGVR